MKKYWLPFLIVFFPVLLRSQHIDGLVARYTFNNNKGWDDVGYNDASIFNAEPSYDRFGNAGYAYYLQGNTDSYINLGNDIALKPIEATISLWVNIHSVCYNGKGVEYNPFIMTRSHPGEDFNEAYSIGYDYNQKNIIATNSFLEAKQVFIHPVNTTSLRKWHHIVMTYDNHFLCLYVDGVIEGKVTKNFSSVFLDNDSVLIGARKQKENERVFNGDVDDIEIFNRVLSPKEVLELYNAPNPNTSAIIFKGISIFVIAAVLVVLIVWLIRKRISGILKKEKDRLAHSYEQDIRILNAQMDPHFVFNSLNTIQHFIIHNENEKAQFYLSKFSRLIRKLLESNSKEGITLKEEMELLKQYLEIESLRFNNTFDYLIVNNTGHDPEKIVIPHFLIQPFVENAIWHGLLPKEGEKLLNVLFEPVNQHMLYCTIEDNGVGRNHKSSKNNFDDKKSLAIDFIKQRLELMNKLRDHTYTLVITDKQDSEGKSEGTKVTITIPILTI